MNNEKKKKVNQLKTDFSQWAQVLVQFHKRNMAAATNVNLLHYVLGFDESVTSQLQFGFLLKFRMVCWIMYGIYS